MSCVFTFSAVQQRLDAVHGKIVAFSGNTPYQRQASRILHKFNALRSVLPYLDQLWQEGIAQSLCQLVSRLDPWSEARLVDVMLHMSTDVSAVEDWVTESCGQLGAPVSTDRGSEAENDWQDGLAFVRQMLRQPTFVEDSTKLRGFEAQHMMHIMQAVLDGMRCNDPCRNTAFKILDELCNTTHTFKPVGIPVLTIRSDLEPMTSRSFKGYLSSGQLIITKSTSAGAASNAKWKREKKFRHEVLLWHQLSHQYVLPLLGITDNHTLPEMTKMISPWCQNGNLTQYLQHPGAINVNRLKLLYEVCVGLSYLHDHVPVVIHANLKCANVLIQEDGSPCLSDFGALPITCRGRAGGSGRWMSVERLCSEDDDTYTRASLTKESDMWSLGMLVLEAFTGQPPYPQLSTDLDVFTAIVRGERPTRPVDWQVNKYGLDDELWQLLSECWDRNPGRRPKLPRFVSVVRRLAGSWSNRSS